MARKGGKKTGVFLGRVGELVVDAATELGVTSQAAGAAARQVVRRVADEFGGNSVYISRESEAQLVERDRELFAAFNGTNTADLARRFHLSERQVSCIIQFQRQALVQNGSGSEGSSRNPQLDPPKARVHRCR